MNYFLNNTHNPSIYDPPRYIAEILLKLALSINQSINQSIYLSMTDILILTDIIWLQKLK